MKKKKKEKKEKVEQFAASSGSPSPSRVRTPPRSPAPRLRRSSRPPGRIHLKKQKTEIVVTDNENLFSALKVYNTNTLPYNISNFRVLNEL